MAIEDFPVVDESGRVIGFDSVNNRELDSEINREVVAKRLGFPDFKAAKAKVQLLRDQGLSQAEAILAGA